MSSGYDLVPQRIERAREQRRDLEREMRAWTDAGAYRVGSQLDPQTGYTVYYVAELTDITPRIVALISEILHTLRTALDNLAYQLFSFAGTIPPTKGKVSTSRFTTTRRRRKPMLSEKSNPSGKKSWRPCAR